MGGLVACRLTPGQKCIAGGEAHRRGLCAQVGDVCCYGSTWLQASRVQVRGMSSWVLFVKGYQPGYQVQGMVSLMVVADEPTSVVP